MQLLKARALVLVPSLLSVALGKRINLSHLTRQCFLFGAVGTRLESPGRGAGCVPVEGPVDQREPHSMAENREPRVTIESELDPVEYTLRKRLPHRLPRRPNDIYVNMKTDFKAQLARCQKLLDGGARGQNACTEIYIHGLGLAINRAINIALQLQAGSFGSLQVAANTSTVELVDELEPETDAQEPLTRIRNNSAIHIRVFRVTPNQKSLKAFDLKVGLGWAQGIKWPLSSSSSPFNWNMVRGKKHWECPALLLLFSLLLLPLGLPVMGALPHLICDSRVLERYILEAREAENATMGCAESCSFGENITVPDTKVNFHAWKRMEVGQQATEVWQGLALLSEAILRGQALLANSSQPVETLHLHVDKAISGLRSLTSLLRALGAQVCSTLLFALSVKQQKGPAKEP
ncbi:Ribonuclease P protein subunit p20 [Manis javanica]|nr:Ribonuclease P protein subunit p20 [Manis javanica]